MPWSESLYWWVVYSALLNLVVLALGSSAMLLCRQPIRRLRVIELTLAGCLVAPWLGMIPGYPQLAILWQPAAQPERQEIPTVPSPRPEISPLPSTGHATSTLPLTEQATPKRPVTGREVAPAFPRSKAVPPSKSALPPEATVKPNATPAQAWSVGSWLLSLYLLGVMLGIAWWLIGMAALVRITSTARSAPPRCRQLLAEIAGQASAHVRLLTSRLAKQPFASVGMAAQLPPQRATWGQAVIVLPESLCDDDQAVRWALAHEWSHIQRGDFRAGFLAGLARVLFFYQPLVWWLRRQLRLCQDYVADARASHQASHPEDYAEFLVGRAASGSLPVAMVGLGMGFSKGKSELYRRIVMLVQNRPLESRPPRLWTVSVTCAALLSVALLAALTSSPQHATGADDDAGTAATASASDTPAEQTKDDIQPQKPSKAKITLDSLGFTTSYSGPGIDDETDKLIKEKKYEFLSTFDSGNGERQYGYRFTYPNGRRLARNFSMPLDEVSSWDDYQKKLKLQREQRNKRISQALTSGKFRLLNLEVMQIHICRDVASESNFKVQRIGRRDSEIALPRADFGKIPPRVKQTSWKEHLQAIRDGKRELLKLETTNNYTYEMTADDGTKDIFQYGGSRPLEEMCNGSAGSTTERTHGARPQGNCSLSGKLVSESTGEPIAGARMYLFYNVTHGSIFIETDSDGAFVFNDIPKGPFSFRSSHMAGYQDAVYDPEDSPGPFPHFTLKDGEQRSGILLKAKAACRIAGEIRDENGNVPSDTRRMSIYAWSKTDDGEKYSLDQGFVKSDGSYVVDGLSDKPVYVMAKNWQDERQGEGYPAIYAPSTPFRDEAKLVTFDESRNVEDVNITLRKTGGLVLEGTVRDEQGEPIPEAFVVVHHRDMLFDRITTYTDAQGHYELQGLGDGEVLVHVDAIHRGFVRTHAPIALEKTSPKVRRDFVLNRGALISGKLVDEDGNEWRMGRSNGSARITEDSQEPEPTSSWSGLPNKHAVKGVDGSTSVFYDPGEGDYDRSEMIFPTRSTFVFPSLKPGHTRIRFFPRAEGKKVVKILHNGEDIMESGVQTEPGQEIKDITIVIGPE